MNIGSPSPAPPFLWSTKTPNSSLNEALVCGMSMSLPKKFMMTSILLNAKVYYFLCFYNSFTALVLSKLMIICCHHIMDEHANMMSLIYSLM